MLKRKPLLLFLLLIIPLGVWAANVFIVDDSGNLTASGSVTLTAQEINGDLTLANDETIDNADDGKLRVTFDDDDPVLGDFILDNLEQKVLLWKDTEIYYLKRQSGEDLNRWVSLVNEDELLMSSGRKYAPSAAAASVNR